MTLVLGSDRAFTPGGINPTRNALAALVGWPSRLIRHRLLMGHMAGMTARELADIGLTRGDVADAVAGPVRRDPSDLLSRRRLERRLTR